MAAMQWVMKALTTALPFTNMFDGFTQVPSTNPSQNATTFAITYGLPLLSYSHLASKIMDNLGKFSTNTFYHQTQLANATFTDINRPNVDTLYSEALVDLSTSNLIVTIPSDFPSDRFYVLPFYDVYGNNFVNLGTAGSSNASGQYLVSYRTADPGYSKGDGSYAGYIYSPTPYGAIDLRIQTNGVDDVPKVNNLQTQFTLDTVLNPVQLAPRLTKSLLFYGFSTNVTEKLLQLTARLSPFNLPEVGYDIARVTSLLRLAGLSGGTYTTPAGVDLELAAAEAAKNIYSVRHDQFSKYFVEPDSNWSYLRPRYSGNFRANYIVRAFVAVQGYLQLRTNQAIYPFYNVSTSLDASQSYNITFSGKPPVNGFWSLTVYNDTAYLIDNPWNIYSLGDRSCIKYSDNSLVYPEGCAEGSASKSLASDGQFTILLQSQDYSPPKEYCSNWIPTPSLKRSNKRFNFNLRWYGPTEELQKSVSEGGYVYPTVTALPAVVTGDSTCPLPSS